MRALTIALAAFATFASAGTSLAADLRVLSEDNRALGMIDAETVQVVGSTRRMKTIAIFAPRGASPATVMVATVLVDCAAPRYQIEALEVFDPAMKQIHQERPTDPPWESAETVSPFTASADFACRGQTLRSASSNDLGAVVSTFLARVAGS